MSTRPKSADLMQRFHSVAPQLDIHATIKAGLFGGREFLFET